MEFKGGEVGSTRQKFLERKKYRESVKIDGVEFIDTWYENPHYGLLNSNNEPVSLNEQDSAITLKTFKDVPDPSLRALPFVVRSFDIFREAYVKKVETTRLSYPRFLNDLSPVKAHISLDQTYETYIDEYIAQLVELLQPDARKLTTFTQVMDRLLEIIEINIKDFPVSRSGFLLSTKCPTNVSGLCVEMSNLDYSLDSFKGDMIQSKDFECYAENANMAGFYVDKNAPWRLIANLESPIMKKEIERYQNNTSIQNTMDRIFRMKTQYQDIYDVTNVFSIVYERFLEKNPYIYNKGVISKVRPSLSNTFFNDNLWIRLCLMVRAAEVDISKSKAEEFLPHVLLVHNLLGAQYASDNKFKAALGEIAIFCSEKIGHSRKNHGIMDSYKQVKLKDYM